MSLTSKQCSMAELVWVCSLGLLIAYHVIPTGLTVSVSSSVKWAQSQYITN